MKDFNQARLQSNDMPHNVPARFLASLFRTISPAAAEDIEDLAHEDTSYDDPWNHSLPFQTLDRLAQIDVLLCGRLDGATRSNFEEIGANARRLHHLAYEAELEGFLSHSFAPRLLVVLHLRDMIGAAERLSGLRLNHPHVGLLILSPQLSRNDFSAERRAICDASLKTGGTFADAAMAVTCALQNHRDFLMRGIFG